MAFPLSATITRVRERLEREPAVEVHSVSLARPARDEVVDQLEERLELPVPPELRELWTADCGGASFGWDAPDSLFGKQCRRGWIHFLSPDEAVRLANDFRDTAAELVEGPDIDDDARAAMREWVAWLPVVRFRTADCFCIAVTETPRAVVFLEHDVMDGGPWQHGLRLAPNLTELLERWSAVAFVEPPSWRDIVGENGLDTGAASCRELFERLRGG